MCVCSLCVCVRTCGFGVEGAKLFFLIARAVTINYHHTTGSRAPSLDDDEEEEDRLHAMISMICSRNLTDPNVMKGFYHECHPLPIHTLSYSLHHLLLACLLTLLLDACLKIPPAHTRTQSPSPTVQVLTCQFFQLHHMDVNVISQGCVHGNHGNINMETKAS